MSKHRRRWPRKKKLLLALAAAVLLLLAAAGSTLAWLTAQSETLSNTFDPASITCETVESFSDGIKSNVIIKNTGTMDAYIRAALIPVWKDGGSIAGEAASLSDCTMVWGDLTTWVLGADGYYYCSIPVPAGDSTPVLIDRCTAAPHDGYHFELQISAQAIQALPASVVTGVWGSAVSGVQADGTLEVAG